MTSIFQRMTLSGKIIACLCLSLLLVTQVMAKSNNTDLILYAEKGNLPKVMQLVNEGADIEQRDQQQRTALMSATLANQIDVARFLIEKGANVNAKDNIQDTPYLYAGARGLQEILELTLANGADLKSLNRYGGTALIPAAERGHIKTVKTLIDAGVAVDHVNSLGWTALIEAIVLGDGSDTYVEIIQHLINGGADVNLADGSGNTPLTLAKQKGFKKIIKTLQDAGAR